MLIYYKIKQGIFNKVLINLIIEYLNLLNNKLSVPIF